MSNRPASRPRWRRPELWVALSIPFLICLYGALMYATLPSKAGTKVSFSEYHRRLADNRIDSAKLLNADSLILFRSDGKEYRAVLPDNPMTVDRALERTLATGIPLEVDKQRLKGLIFPAIYLVPGILLISVILLTFLLSRSGGGGFLKSSARKGGHTEKPVTFADVAGADEAVAEIREVRDYLKNPERFQAFGAEPPRGILLVGPPGTGKTLLARAVAGEAGVPFFSISGTEFVEMWVGVGAARVRDLFRQVRESAPAILFIDELDAAGRARAGSATSGQEERDNTVNQLLVEMDGFEGSTGVVLIGATNRPDVLDPAILRRGRFDRQIVVDRPDRAGRLAILKVHARGKRLDPGLKLESLAAVTPGFTGADLASVMNEAALLAARRNKTVIGGVELEEAVDRVIAGNERRARLLSPEEKRAVAYHEGGHAIVAWALPGTDPVSKISIVSRGQALGLTWMVPDEERFLVSESELFSRMAVSMGGMAAEELVLGETTSGPRDDLRRATRVARQMVCEYGMSESLGKLALGRDVGTQFLGGDLWQADYSDEVAAEIDREVRRITGEAFSLAGDVLAANRDVLDNLAAALIEHETLREPELAAFAAAVVHPEHVPPSARRAGEGRLAIRPVSSVPGARARP